MLRLGVFLLVLLTASTQYAAAAQSSSGNAAIVDVIRKYNRIELDADLARKSRSEPKVAVVDRGKLADEVRTLIAGGADVNAADGSGRTALMQAMFHDQDQLVELLLAQGADVKAKDKQGATALIFASYRVNPHVVRLLLEADPNAPVDRRTGVLESFITNPVDADTPSAEVDDALKRQIACIRILVRHGVPINGAGSEGQTPLMAAAVRGRTELVADMLKLGANVHAKDSTGTTALIAASMFGKTDTVKLLLANGARADNKPSSSDHGAMTPLLAAITSKHEETALLLIAHTSRALLDLRGPPGYRHGRGGYTALGGAIENNMDDVILGLVKKGVSLNVPGDESGVTPLAMAAQQRKLKTVKLLLERGANLEAKDAQGNTALMHIASYGPNPDMLELLIKKGALVNARNRAGETALDLTRQDSAQQENEAVLMRHGAVAKGVRSGCSPCR